MAFLEFNGIKIAGLSAAVPSSIEECVNIYKKWGGTNTSFQPQVYNAIGNLILLLVLQTCVRLLQRNSSAIYNGISKRLKH